MLADAIVYVPAPPILDGISLLIGAFFFYSLAHPERVKNRTQFWAVFAVLILLVLFYTLRLMLYNAPGGQVFTGIFIGLLQVAGLVLTVMPGSSSPCDRFCRLAACFITLSRDRSSPHRLRISTSSSDTT